MRASFRPVIVAVLWMSVCTEGAFAQAHPFVYSISTKSFTAFEFGNACSTLSINDLKHSAGSYSTSFDGLACHGFIKAGDSFTSFDYPGAYFTGSRGINNAGQIVGQRCLPSTTEFPDCAAFVKDRDTFTSYVYPGALFTYGNAINNTGTIAGKYRIEVEVGTNAVQDFDHGLLIDGGVFTVVDVPGALNTELNGINDALDIVGYYSVLTNSWPGYRIRGFLKQGSVFTAIDFPGALFTAAMGINNLGQVIGYYVDNYLLSHGFIKDGDKFLSLDVPAADTFLFGINNLGEIVGQYYPRNVAAPLQTLVSDVEGSALPRGTKSSLLDRLNVVRAAFNDGNVTTACGVLGAFINTLEAHAGKKIPLVVGTDLVDQATRIQALMGCH